MTGYSPTEPPHLGNAEPGQPAAERGGGTDPPHVAATTVADAREEARRILAAAEAATVDLRVIGGVGIALRCPSANRPPLARNYLDIDFAARSRDVRPLTQLFTGVGYEPSAEFNALHGQHRLRFWDPQHDREADVFLDSLTMCHSLRFRERLTVDRETLPLRELLLFKLQVMETNEKDYKDALALLADHPSSGEGFDAPRIARFLANDWCWWRTATIVLERIEAYANDLSGLEARPELLRRIKELQAAIDSEPKSRRWRLRAKIGDRKRWYEIPEEAH